MLLAKAPLRTRRACSPAASPLRLCRTLIPLARYRLLHVEKTIAAATAFSTFLTLLQHARAREKTPQKTGKTTAQKQERVITRRSILRGRWRFVQVRPRPAFRKGFVGRKKSLHREHAAYAATMAALDTVLRAYPVADRVIVIQAANDFRKAERRESGFASSFKDRIVLNHVKPPPDLQEAAS